MSRFDLKQWVIDCKLDITSASVSQGYHGLTCIFRAPMELLNEHKDAYVPRVVSIGPYHFQKQELREMERFKSDAAYRQLVRIRNKTKNTDFSFDQLIDKISDKLGEIFRCYDKDIPYSYDAKVMCMMMARDACFILEFLRSYMCQVEEINRSIDEGFELDEPLHPIFGLKSENHVVKSEIMRDLIKLENQIPLCVLEEVLAMEQVAAPEEIVATKEVHVATQEILAMKQIVAPEEASFIEKLKKALEKDLHNKNLEETNEKLQEAQKKLEKAWETALHSNKLEKAKPKIQILLKAAFQNVYYRPFDYIAHEESPWKNHILDIYYYYSLREGYKHGPLTLKQHNKVQEALRSWKFPSAVDLKNGGVKIEANDGKIPDVRFHDGSLLIPPIKFDVDSEIFIRNLIALEICSPYLVSKSFTEYVQFMDELCETEEGVSLMREKRIISGNLRHPSQVIHLLNISSRVAFQPTSVSPALLSRAELVMYSRKRRIAVLRSWNEFRKTYFPKPWLWAGAIGATAILILTVVQVYCLYHSCGAHKS